MKDTSVLIVDSGSGSLKIAKAKINSQTGEAENVTYFDTPMSMATDLELHKLAEQIQKTGQIPNAVGPDGQFLNICSLFNPNLNQATYAPSEILNGVSSKKAHDELMAKYGNKFSEEIKEQYLDLMIQNVRAIKETNPNDNIGFWLVGTAALRKADDGQLLLDTLSNRLKKEGIEDINARIITQREEGIFAFESAMQALDSKESNIVVGDAGGGSRQFVTADDGENLKVVGDTAASAASRKTLISAFKIEGDSIYPFTKNKREAIEILKKTFDLQSENTEEKQWLDNKIRGDAQVVGVGNIYRSLLSTMKHNGLKKPQDVEYTREDVDQLIDLLSGKSKEEVKLLIPEESHEFLENILVNTILIAATMETHEIKQIKIAEVSNAQTLLNRATKHYNLDNISNSERQDFIAPANKPEASINNPNPSLIASNTGDIKASYGSSLDGNLALFSLLNFGGIVGKLGNLLGFTLVKEKSTQPIKITEVSTPSTPHSSSPYELSEEQKKIFINPEPQTQPKFSKIEEIEVIKRNIEDLGIQEASSTNNKNSITQRNHLKTKSNQSNTI
ncbi:MAG: hypothetical protein WBJ81_02115 [Rickettsiales bacterium]